MAERNFLKAAFNSSGENILNIVRSDGTVLTLKILLVPAQPGLKRHGTIPQNALECIVIDGMTQGHGCIPDCLNELATVCDIIMKINLIG